MKNSKTKTGARKAPKAVPVEGHNPWAAYKFFGMAMEPDGLTWDERVDRMLRECDEREAAAKAARKVKKPAARS